MFENEEYVDENKDFTLDKEPTIKVGHIQSEEESEYINFMCNPNN